MAKIKKMVAGLAALSMLVLPVATLGPATAEAQVFGPNLGQAFVLNRLFNGPFGLGGGYTTYGDLLIWNQLLNRNFIGGPIIYW